MPCCATNNFASKKRKLPRDLVISSEAQASAEVAMALIALISRARMQTHPELNGTTVIQPETRREAPVRVPFHEALWALLLLILGIAGCSGTNAPPTPAFVYAANNGSNNVSAFSVTPSTGALAPVTGSPYAAGTSPAAIAADPRGKFVYVANVGSNNVSAYATDPASGALATVPGSPFSTGIFPTSVTVDPSG